MQVYRKRWLAALGVAGAVTVLFVFFEPLRWPLFPKCVLHEVTGWYCPGCGGSRAVRALAHGEILTALRCNALLLLALPAVVYWLCGGEATRIRPFWIWLFVGLLLLYGLLRNVPVYPFSLLAPC